jgi:cyclase
MLKIAPNVYTEISSRGCNFSWVVTKDGVVIIDTPPVPSDAIKWNAEISKYGPIRYVINTEPHMDHFAGNGFLGGTLIAHDGVREMISKAGLEQLQDMIKRFAPESPPPAKDFQFRLPDITYSQSLTLHLGNHTFKLMNMPGHTPFQTMVFVPEERVVFTSDNVVHHVHPYLHQSVPFTWLDTLKQMQKLDADIFVPGHGNVTDKSGLKDMADLVQAWIDAVQKALDEGMPLDEAKKIITMVGRFPYLKRDARTELIEGMSITRLYEVLQKK